MAAFPATSPAPVPAVFPLTPELRLAYVLRHFRLAYEDVPPVTVSYDEQQAGVTVADGAGDFFEQASPCPPAPGWRDWQGQRIPFFFDNDPEQPLLKLKPAAARINADVVAAAFYLLSGWQEYFSPARDRHGRFPYAASVQQRYGFVTLPVVNYYFGVLKAAVEHVAGRPLQPRRWGAAPFAAFITHDIDNIHGGWGTAARRSLRQGRPAELLKLLLRKATGGPAPWNNLEAVQAATTRFGAPSTFFILGSDQPAANGTRNADYDAAAPAFLQRLTRLAAAGAEIGSHGSYGTATSSEALQHEISHLPAPPPVGNRFHYLGWEPTLTPQVLARAGVAYDSTLGFAEHFGFRHSYCHPFFPFDFQRGRAHEFLEIPLNMMDATLHHPSYLQLSAAQVLPALQPMLLEIEKFGGVASVLWHNENFDPANEVNGPRQFDELMGCLQQRGARFVSGREIVQQLCRP